MLWHATLHNHRRNISPYTLWFGFHGGNNLLDRTHTTPRTLFAHTHHTFAGTCITPARRLPSTPGAFGGAYFAGFLLTRLTTRGTADTPRWLPHRRVIDIGLGGTWVSPASPYRHAQTQVPANRRTRWTRRLHMPLALFTPPPWLDVLFCGC